MSSTTQQFGITFYGIEESGRARVVAAARAWTAPLP